MAGDTEEPRNATKPGAHSDTLVAVRNALVLGASLVATWSVALVVRMVLPRVLGPERFGQYNFAESFTTTCAVVLSFGIETHIQKEIPARPEHAKDFVGGTLLARLGAIVLIILGQHGFALLTHRPDDVRRSLFIFAIAQLAAFDANLFAGLLHATRTVGRLAIINVVTKLLWAGGMLAAVALGARLEVLAAAFLLSEAVRAVSLFAIARRKLHLPIVVDVAATRAAIRSSLPYYVNAIAITVYAKIDVTIMAMQLTDAEVGWYGTAWGVAGITMLLTPLMSAVLMPQLSRAAARSHEELFAMFRRSLELLLILAIPVSLLMGISADLVMGKVFGPKFLPAVWALRLLAPMFVLTYLAMLAAMTLVMSGRGWTATAISLGSIAANAGLNVVLLRPGLERLGTGGGGTTAAAISVSTEAMVTVAMIVTMGVGHAFDRRNLGVFAKCGLACAVAIGVHVSLAGLGPVRVLIACAAYAVVALATGAVRPGDLVATLRDAWRRRRGEAA